jgi:hypothetical protein
MPVVTAANVNDTTMFQALVAENARGAGKVGTARPTDEP